RMRRVRFGKCSSTQSVKSLSTGVGSRSSTHEACWAPARAAASMMRGISSSLRPGMTGPIMRPVGTPAARSAAIVSRRFSGCAALEAAGEVAVEGGDRAEDVHGAEGSEGAEEIGVAGDEARLGDHADRVAEVEEDLEAATCQAEPALDRLVAVGVAGQRHQLRFPGPGRELRAEQRRCVLLHHDAALEVEASAEAEELV